MINYLLQLETGVFGLGETMESEIFLNFYGTCKTESWLKIYIYNKYGIYLTDDLHDILLLGLPYRDAYTLDWYTRLSSKTEFRESLFIKAIKLIKSKKQSISLVSSVLSLILHNYTKSVVEETVWLDLIYIIITNTKEYRLSLCEKYLKENNLWSR